MKSLDYHGVLEVLGVACGLARADVVFIRNPLQGFVLSGLFAGGFLSRILWKVGVFFRHIILVFRLWLLARHQKILVREFSNLPLFFVCFGLIPLRKKLVFTVNHNLQWAVRSRAEGFAFRMLDQLGFCFMFFETLDCDGMRQLGLHPNRHWVIPLPVTKQDVSCSAEIPFTVGIVGHYRKEKGIDEVLDVLLADDPTFHLILGIPNIGDFVEQSDHGEGAARFELRDTSSSDLYHATLSECDVVLLCYTSDGYRFRASGLMADAAACGSVVLVPDFPILRHQIEYPVAVGQCYSELTQIPSLIFEVSKELERYKGAIDAYCAGRSAIALAKVIDGLAE